MVLISPSLAQPTPDPSGDAQAFKQQLQQLQDQIQQAIQAQDQQKVQELKAQEDALILGRMQQMNAQGPKSQLTVNAQERFTQIRAKREAWLKAHPAEAAKQAQYEQFVQSQLPLFFELGAAVKSGDTQKAQQIRAQLAAARKQWLQTLPATSP